MKIIKFKWKVSKKGNLRQRWKIKKAKKKPFYTISKLTPMYISSENNYNPE